MAEHTIVATTESADRLTATCSCGVTLSTTRAWKYDVLETKLRTNIRQHQRRYANR